MNPATLACFWRSTQDGAETTRKHSRCILRIRPKQAHYIIRCAGNPEKGVKQGNTVSTGLRQNVLNAFPKMKEWFSTNVKFRQTEGTAGPVVERKSEG